MCIYLLFYGPYFVATRPDNVTFFNNNFIFCNSDAADKWKVLLCETLKHGSICKANVPSADIFSSPAKTYVPFLQRQLWDEQCHY